MSSIEELAIEIYNERMARLKGGENISAKLYDFKVEQVVKLVLRLFAPLDEENNLVSSVLLAPDCCYVSLVGNTHDEFTYIQDKHKNFYLTPTIRWRPRILTIKSSYIAPHLFELRKIKIGEETLYGPIYEKLKDLPNFAVWKNGGYEKGLRIRIKEQ